MKLKIYLRKLVEISFWTVTAISFAHAAIASNSATSRLCDSAARVASKEFSVPKDILLAISRTETGHNIGGSFDPWPWAINIEGKGQWLPDKSDAVSILRYEKSRGTRNFDVGCFQINYHWHGKYFHSIEHMIDPVENARYAARFLKKLYAEHRNWFQAVGAYHSRQEVNARQYLARFEPIYSSLKEDSSRSALAENTASLTNSFPLLRGNASASSKGSLFPRNTANRGRIAGLLETEVE